MTMKNYTERDLSLETLLDLNGEIFLLENGCWTKFEAQKITWDHKHKIDKVYPYEFESASQLIEDFWKAVEEILK